MLVALSDRAACSSAMAGPSGSTCSLGHAPVRPNARRQRRQRAVASAAATAGATHAAAEQVKLGSSDLLVSSEWVGGAGISWTVRSVWFVPVAALCVGREARRLPQASRPLPFVLAECCLGTMTWGMQNTEEEAHQQLSCAWDDYGINFLDVSLPVTRCSLQPLPCRCAACSSPSSRLYPRFCPSQTAEIYPVPPAQETQGRTEQYIGSWLKGRKRDSVVLATKVRCGCAVPTSEWMPS